jgi:hypothetical protein
MAAKTGMREKTRMVEESAGGLERRWEREKRREEYKEKNGEKKGKRSRKKKGKREVERNAERQTITIKSDGRRVHDVPWALSPSVFHPRRA